MNVEPVKAYMLCTRFCSNLGVSVGTMPRGPPLPLLGGCMRPGARTRAAPSASHQNWRCHVTARLLVWACTRVSVVLVPCRRSSSER